VTTEVQPYSGPLAPLLNDEVRRLEIEVTDWDMMRMSRDELSQYEDLVESAKAHGLEVLNYRDEIRRVNIFVICRPIDPKVKELFGVRSL
jgi:hypothetical protein